jgi:hypothetical protein
MGQRTPTNASRARTGRVNAVSLSSRHKTKPTPEKPRKGGPKEVKEYLSEEDLQDIMNNTKKALYRMQLERDVREFEDLNDKIRTDETYTKYLEEESIPKIARGKPEIGPSGKLRSDEELMKMGLGHKIPYYGLTPEEKIVKQSNEAYNWIHPSFQNQKPSYNKRQLKVQKREAKTAEMIERRDALETSLLKRSDEFDKAKKKKNQLKAETGLSMKEWNKLTPYQKREVMKKAKRYI